MTSTVEVVMDSRPPIAPTFSSPASRSPSPDIPVQPDHFYSFDESPQPFPLSPDSTGRTHLRPDDDPFATRGIPVFKPTMDEFQDFEGYMNKVECWGTKSGIVKVIPPKEWTDALPALNEHLAKVRLKSPIEQNMLGRAGLFRQQNVEKPRHMSVREWSELCAKEELRAPGVDDVGLKAASENTLGSSRRRGRSKKAVKTEDQQVELKVEEDGTDLHDSGFQKDGPSAGGTSIQHLTPPPSDGETVQSPAPSNPVVEKDDEPAEDDAEAEQTSGKRKRRTQTHARREALLAQRVKQDEEFMKDFDPHSDWLPPNTTAHDYTPEFCATLERRYWRNCGLGKPAWYGADMAGSLFTDATTCWNVAKLPSALSRLLPASNKALAGVNTPYLYFGMWRATFAWHVEDMDLFSINYIHFGAPKFWYAIPQMKSVQLENAMRSHFPRDTSKCSQFLRHKSFLASPTILGQSSCKPNMLVQHAGEFVITYPRGYHAGFNLGFNCAESVNFALNSWLELGRKAQACTCVGDSVRIDVDDLIRQKAEEELEEAKRQELAKAQALAQAQKKDKKPPSSKKHKIDESSPSAPSSKRVKKESSGSTSHSKPASKTPSAPKLTLKLPPAVDAFPCCLCISRSEDGLLRVHDKPPHNSKCPNVVPKDNVGHEVWRAHEQCAMIVPETWVDEVEIDENGMLRKEKVVFGVDGISKDRWELKCCHCTKPRNKVHGAPVQCTKGKCSKAFHISCARDGEQAGIAFKILQEVEKSVVLSGSNQSLSSPAQPAQPAQADDHIVPATGSADAGSAAAPLPDAAMPNVSDDPPAQVLSTVKKAEIELLCPQHNPVIAAAKKASKIDKVRRDLLALAEGARVKVRVSSGVFEVSLVRVIEDRGAVEVLWDGGHKREFKWGSLVWGMPEGQNVGQKPSVAAPPPPTPDQRKLAAAPIYRMNVGSGGQQASSSTGTYTPVAGSSSNPSAYTYPSYASGGHPYSTYPYSAYGSYNPYAHQGSVGTYTYSYGNYPGSFTAPYGGAPAWTQQSATQSGPVSYYQAAPGPISGSPPTNTVSSPTTAHVPIAPAPATSSAPTLSTYTPSSAGSSTSSNAPVQPVSTAISPTLSTQSPTTPAPAQPSSSPVETRTSPFATPQDAQNVLREIQALSSLDAAGIEQVLRTKPQLRDTIKALLTQSQNSGLLQAQRTSAPMTENTNPTSST